MEGTISVHEAQLADRNRVAQHTHPFGRLPGCEGYNQLVSPIGKHTTSLHMLKCEDVLTFG